MKRLVLCAASAVLSCSTLAVVVGGAPVAGAQSAANGTFLPAPGHHAVRAIRNVDLTSSTNWAGYVQSTRVKHTFTAVSDTFAVPTVDAGAADGSQYAADWVGIGGYAGRDRTLVQTGIQTVATTTSRGTTVTYNAWTETLPRPEDALATPTLHPGDVVTATVQETAKNRWVMTVDDVTTDQSGSRSVTYHSKGLSAEAIHERPCLEAPCNASDLASLAQTSNVTFDPGSFSDTPPGTTPVDQPLLDSVTGLTVTDVQMTNNTGSEVIATPSLPNGTFDGFTVADGSSPPDPPTD